MLLVLYFCDLKEHFRKSNKKILRKKKVFLPSRVIAPLMGWAGARDGWLVDLSPRYHRATETTHCIMQHFSLLSCRISLKRICKYCKINLSRFVTRCTWADHSSQTAQLHFPPFQWAALPSEDAKNNTYQYLILGCKSRRQLKLRWLPSSTVPSTGRQDR